MRRALEFLLAGIVLLVSAVLVMLVWGIVFMCYICWIPYKLFLNLRNFRRISFKAEDSRG